MNTCLINCSNPQNLHLEADIYVDYRNGGYGACFDGSRRLKECRSWHSLPAVLGTEFFVYNKPQWEGVYKYQNVLMLINRDLHLVEPLLKKLKLMKKKVLIGFHENGYDFSLSSMNPSWLIQFKNLCEQADGYLNVNVKKDAFFKELFRKNIHNILHAFPFEEWKHGLTQNIDARQGILIGTRTLNQRLPRNTLEALVVANRVARECGTFATYLNEDPIDMTSLLKDLKLDHINVIKGPFSYEKWIELISFHRLILHADKVGTLGQIVGDACLVDVPCLGSNSDMSIISRQDCTNEQLFDWATSIYKVVSSKPKSFEGHLEHIKKVCSAESIRNRLMEIIK